MAEPEAAVPETPVTDGALEATPPDAVTTGTTNTGRARRAAIVGLRVVAGTVGLVAAAAIVAFVGLAPIPSHRITVPTVVVTPQPADQVRLCDGALLRLGDESGQNAGTASAIASPSVTAGASGAAVASSPLASSDAGTGGSKAAPTQLTLPPVAGGTVSGAQSQQVAEADDTGFAAAACAEPTASIWLVGGSTAVGRTTLLTLANASAVDATVALTILGPNGAITAPGMSGIIVKSGEQRVIPLAGFAPDVAAPVVHVVARGGQVTAALQQSIVRGLDPGGVDIVSASADPAKKLVIPGIRVVNAVGANRALALPDWDDVAAAVRVAVPGTAPAKVQVSLVPQDASLTGLSFEMDVAGGQTSELPLDSAEATDTGGVAIPDGSYTVVLTSDRPIVGGVRVSTVQDTAGADATASSDTVAPPCDFAWYASAPLLGGDTEISVAAGPSPVFAAMNPGTTDITVVLDAGDGSPLSLKVPAGAAASLPVAPGTSYLLRGAKGLAASISYAGNAQLAAYPLTSPRPVSGPITVHP